ncbi:iron reductase domain protein [Xylariomycetidae sp. FL0641]|nr:iron reductase domain protein [Xylariomycetidae sp. FL0641]
MLTMMTMTMQALKALAALSALPLALSSPASHCPTDNVCYQVGVPSASAASGSGDIYLQLSAPTSYAWVALGTGTQMAGADMFVLYADGAGNVTVSPRRGTGHVEPAVSAQTRLTRLAGSGVAGGRMLANVRCAGCAAGDGGGLDLAASRTDWIAAWKQGGAVDSADADAALARHDAHAAWQFDLTSATVADDDANPFVDDGSGSSGSSTGSGSSGSGDGGSQGGSSGSGSGSGSSGVVGDGSGNVPAWVREIPGLASAHGWLMAVVMVLLYPLGSTLMPLFGKWWLHGAWQLVAFLAMWAGFGLGVVLAQRTGYDFHTHHTTFGTVIVALFGLQPVGGYLHHLHYVKHRQRGAISYGHIWYGRALMIMGIVNGGLGLKLADPGRSYVVAYSVVAAIVFALYAAGALMGIAKRRRAPNQPSTKHNVVVRSAKAASQLTSRHGMDGQGPWLLTGLAGRLAQVMGLRTDAVAIDACEARRGSTPYCGPATCRRSGMLPVRLVPDWRHKAKGR